MNQTPKIKNPALLKFSKEALAYYIEISRILIPEEQMLAALKSIDRYFSSVRSLNRINATTRRLAEIDEAFSKSPKMSSQRRLALMREQYQLIKRLRICDNNNRSTKRGGDDV